VKSWALLCVADEFTGMTWIHSILQAGLFDVHNQTCQRDNQSRGDTFTGPTLHVSIWIQRLQSWWYDQIQLRTSSGNLHLGLRAKRARRSEFVFRHAWMYDQTLFSSSNRSPLWADYLGVRHPTANPGDSQKSKSWQGWLRAITPPIDLGGHFQADSDAMEPQCAIWRRQTAVDIIYQKSNT
jgi:hypothetical protein